MATEKRPQRTDMEERLLELLPDNSPARYSETGVSVLEQILDMHSDFKKLVQRLNDENLLQGSIVLEDASKWVKEKDWEW